MSTHRIAARYAKSLLEIAKEQKRENSIFADMKEIKRVCAEHKEIRLVLKSPIVKSDVKLRTLRKIFASQDKLITGKFFEILCRKGRENILFDIACAYIELYYEDKNLQEVEVTTVVEIDDNLRKKLREIIAKTTNATLIFNEKIDTSILGGFVLKMNNTLMDSSVSAKLRKIEKQLIKQQ